MSGQHLKTCKKVLSFWNSSMVRVKIYAKNKSNKFHSRALNLKVSTIVIENSLNLYRKLTKQKSRLYRIFITKGRRIFWILLTHMQAQLRNWLTKIETWKKNTQQFSRIRKLSKMKCSSNQTTFYLSKKSITRQASNSFIYWVIWRIKKWKLRH